MRLSLDQVSKRYGGQVALDRISINLDGGIVALLGANGSGKTTLLRLLATLDLPDTGRIDWGEQNYLEILPDLRRHIGYLPQVLELPPHLTPYRLLCYLAQLRNANLTAVDDLITGLKLESIAHKRIAQLSSGQIRQVGVAQAFLGQPKLLLLDELSSGLDVIERERVNRLLPNDGRLTVFSTHIPDEAERIATSVVVLHQGRVLFAGTIAELKARVGECFETTLPTADAQLLLHEAGVSRMIHQNGSVTLRCSGGRKASDTTRLINPSLEDAYLFLLLHAAG
ncbi:MAG: ABC transporter ATP-binding protein [Anaerolineae bacterium]